MKKILFTFLAVCVLTCTANAQSITPNGLNQGDLVALLQNIVDALGSTVGSTYITAGTAKAISGGAASFTTLAASSPASFANGTAALPSLTFTSDPNTGIYRYASDTIGLATGGAFRAFISDTLVHFHDAIANVSFGSTAGGGRFYFSIDGTTSIGLKVDNGSTYPYAWRVNSSANTSFAATDVASSTARVGFGGIARFDGTVAGAAVTNPVLQIKGYDESDGSTMTLPTTPAAKYCNLFAKTNASGKMVLVAQWDSGVTTEVAIEP